MVRAGRLACLAQPAALINASGLRQLIRHGANVLARCIDGRTALHTASSVAATSAMTELVTAASELGVASELLCAEMVGGFTALHLAASGSDCDGDFTRSVRVLLKLGAAIEARATLGLTALHMAAHAGDPTVTRFYHRRCR